MSRFGLCRSCMYYQPMVRTTSCSVPSSCTNPKVLIFDPGSGGFHSGMDVFYCDYHEQAHFSCGHVMYRMKDGGIVSMLETRENKCRCVSELTSNVQNIREASLKRYEQVSPSDKSSFVEDYDFYSSDLISPF